MKKITSYLLVGLLLFATCIQGFAVENGQMQTDESAITADQQKPGAENGKEVEEKLQAADKQEEGNLQDAKSEESVTKEDNKSTDDEEGQSKKDNQEEQALKVDAKASKQAKEAVRATEPVQEPLKNTGQVDVYISGALAMQQPVEFTVLLSGQGKEFSKKITVQEEAAGSVVEPGITFENLAAGTYTLRVRGNGFAEYVQKLEVDRWGYTVKLCTGFVSGFTYAKSGVHPGVLLVGDVDKNKVIDNKDRKLIVDAVQAGSKATGDLDKNGRADLVDLEYFAQSYKTKADISASLEKSVPSAALKTGSGNDTTVKGSLTQLSQAEREVVLTRADGVPISDAAPVSVNFDFLESEGFPIRGMVLQTQRENPISKAEVAITYLKDGVETTKTVPFVEGVDFLLNDDKVHVTQDGSGAISVHLGTQIAVKRVTLTIKGMKKNNNLAEISRVEFVNDMESRIPEPDMDIPENLSVEPGNKQFTLSWDPCKNVTGYQVMVSHEGIEEVLSVRGCSLTVNKFNEKELVNKQEYMVKVQSTNGAWRSGYGEAVKAVPKTDKKPDAPDNVRAEGKYKSIEVSWKDMKDTDSYNLFYREVGTGDYKKVANISTNRYMLMELKDVTAYELYVTGVNDLGESSPSLKVKAETIDIKPAQMPKYKLLNKAGENEVSSHIIKATIALGSMKDSPKDTQPGDAWGTVDNNPASYYTHGTWDGGGFNPMGSHGVTYEFDQAYEMQLIALQEVVPQGTSYGYVSVRYWDENEKATTFQQRSIQKKKDANGRAYYWIKLPQAIKAKKLQIGLARSSVSGTVNISEVYFYYYDTIEEDIMKLYVDDLHTVLRDDVTQSTINALRTRINTVDEVSGEYHPERANLEKELETAEDILNNSKLSDSVVVHNGIRTGDVGRGFGGLNAWQPLGVSAAAGEEISVYVGHNTKRTGDDTNLQLVATQYHAESSPMSQVVKTLKIGKNEITVPKIWSTDEESGGALYVQYTGSNNNDKYAVRVSGGVQVPRLDLYQVTDAAERTAKAEKYITELESYVSNMQAKHTEVHQNSDNKLVQYEYNERNCILGASDIMLDTMMLSLPAKQILNGSGSGSVQDKAKKLLTSMDAMEGMMNLFYQHKGLNNNAKDDKGNKDEINCLPNRHLNIRYQRMFAGAFMYAGGDHIGIEWPETAGMMGGVPVQSDSKGKYVSGRYFGWGIAHEIGHCINQETYAVAEITNNYFAVLAQAKDNNETVRFKYPNVYDKVTSATQGRASNVFTQLGMYWQLHLAYDNGYNYKTYADPDEQLSNLFFARVDTYARTASKAPKPGDIALKLSGNRDQDLMRLCCAAANKNILEFFERWGMVPDADTKAYAGQFTQETRAIFYASDDARVYRLEHGGSSLNAAGTVEAVGDGTSASVNASNASQVDFTLSSKTIPTDDILGYEIMRGTISNGEVEKEIAGFTTGNTFHDVVTTMNNRVVIYEVRVIDKYLNRSAAKTLAPIKIEHDGSIDKTYWTATTNDLTATNVGPAGSADEDTPCAPPEEDPIMKALDNDGSTSYTATAKAGAEVIVEFNKTLTVTGFKYTINSGNAIGDYGIYVRDDKNQWVEAATGTFTNDPVQTVYFGKKSNKNIAAYKTTAVKLAIKNQAGKDIAISELDVLGVTGDNVDFRRAEGSSAAVIGRLSSDYKYGKEADDVIPAGSIVFTGSYKGNPAYNVVILYDQDGNIVGAPNADGDLKAYQTVLADVPENGKIEDVYDGTWIYWLDPKDNPNLSNLKKVRAELYRVDNALTNEGQRLVSDSLFEVVPENLPEIQLSSN